MGAKEIREFLGVMASHQLKRGTYATALLDLIATRTPEQQQALLAVAWTGETGNPMGDGWGGNWGRLVVELYDNCSVPSRSSC